MKTATLTTIARFVSSYRGESHYEINGTKYAARTFFQDDGRYTNPDEVRATVGTVRVLHFPGARSFPPASVLAHFPGYTAARYVDGPNGLTLEYQGGTPPYVRLNSFGAIEIAL